MLGWLSIDMHSFHEVPYEESDLSVFKSPSLGVYQPHQGLNIWGCSYWNLLCFTDDIVFFQVYQWPQLVSYLTLRLVSCNQLLHTEQWIEIIWYLEHKILKNNLEFGDKVPLLELWLVLIQGAHFLLYNSIKCG